MQRIVILYDRIVVIAASRLAEGIALLLARIALAGMFWRSGRSKVTDGSLFEISDSTRYLFENDYSAVPLPAYIAALLATFGEHLFPMLLVIGLATRLSAAALLPKGRSPLDLRPIRMVEVVASDNQRMIGDAQELLAGLAGRPLVRALDEGRCDPLLAEFKALFPRYANLAITDRDGHVICSAIGKASGSRPSVSAMAWFADVKRENRFLAGKAHVGPISGKWVAVLAQPIQDGDGGFSGLIGSPCRLRHGQITHSVPAYRALPAGSLILNPVSLPKIRRQDANYAHN